MAQAKSYKPDNVPVLAPHITVKDGNKAIEFYTRAFGAKEAFRMAGPSGGILHASLRIGDSTLMLNDEFPGMGDKSPATLGGSPVTLSLYVPDVDKTVKDAEAAGAKVVMPVQDMFWGDRYGKLVDPFGHLWEISTHKEDVPPEEMEQRGRKAMAEMGMGG